MYHYLENQEFLHRMRSLSGELMQALCHHLKEEHDIGAQFCLIGSGARNLITQNANEPVDLDYNLEIVRCEDFGDCRFLKECTRRAFNKALQEFGLHDCEDSTSALTSKQIWFDDNRNLRFSIDVCITARDKNHTHHRLIHEKTGWVGADKYYWNIAPQSKNLREKADFVKRNGQWNLVRAQYLNIKNHYLRRGDSDHPSFICYAEAVQNVYNAIKCQ